MSRHTNQLTVKRINAIKEAGAYLDGQGLYLTVGQNMNKWWTLRLHVRGKRREMGLGRLEHVSLAEARRLASEARAAAAAGRDPIAERNAARTPEPESAQPSGPTFREAAEAFIAAKWPEWRSPVAARQWPQSMRDHVYPVIGDKPVAQITTDDVLAVVSPIWNTKTETASRARNRIERVLKYAKVRGWRDGPNPAAWRDHLDHALANPSKVKATKGHPSMAYQDLPTFFPRLQVADGMGARGLEYCILTAARTGEVMNATWSEIDWDAATWEIPGERMKAGQPHTVPLSTPALTLLRKLWAARLSDDGYIFLGQQPGKPLSGMAMLTVLRRLGHERSATVHGFRASFRTWAGSETSYPHDLLEMALAHGQDKVVGAYQRGSMLERRRALMEDWAQFVEGQGRSNVVPLQRAG